MSDLGAHPGATTALSRSTSRRTSRSTSRSTSRCTAVWAIAVAGTLALQGCSAGGGASPPETVVTTVTRTVSPTTGPTPQPFPTTGTTSQGPSSTAAPHDDGEEADDAHDAAWFAQADDACSIAIDEYGSWKAKAGSGAAPEALALGASAAATRAADSISALPTPSTHEALGLRAAVVAWAGAYRSLASAMERGRYSEVTAAGDAAEAAANRIRSAAASAPSCAAMTDRV